MSSINSLFPREKVLIAVIHLKALPGAPRYEGSMQSVIDQAMTEARIFQDLGVDGLIIENFRDNPFYPDVVPPETIASMSVVANQVVNESKVPVGINILRNDAHAAMAVATATGADFIRVNVHSGAMMTDQGIIQSKAWNTLRVRQALRSKVMILADVAVKHAAPIAQISLADEVRDVTKRGMANGVIVSGSGTGQTADPREVKEAKDNTEFPVWIGSGINADNISSFINIADGFIVGSAFKVGGMAANAVDPEASKPFIEHFRELRGA